MLFVELDCDDRIYAQAAGWRFDGSTNRGIAQKGAKRLKISIWGVWVLAEMDAKRIKGHKTWI